MKLNEKIEEVPVSSLSFLGINNKTKLIFPQTGKKIAVFNKKTENFSVEDEFSNMEIKKTPLGLEINVYEDGKKSIAETLTYEKTKEGYGISVILSFSKKSGEIVESIFDVDTGFKIGYNCYNKNNILVDSKNKIQQEIDMIVTNGSYNSNPKSNYLREEIISKLKKLKKSHDGKIKADMPKNNKSKKNGR